MRLVARFTGYGDSVEFCALACLVGALPFGACPVSVAETSHYEAQVASWLRHWEKTGVRFAVDTNGALVTTSKPRAMDGNVWALIAEHAETIAGLVGAR